MLMSKRIPLTVCPSYTVDYLRNIAADILNLPPGLIVFTYDGRKLEDGNILADYRITNESLIRVALPTPQTNRGW